MTVRRSRLVSGIAIGGVCAAAGAAAGIAGSSAASSNNAPARPPGLWFRTRLDGLSGGPRARFGPALRGRLGGVIGGPAIHAQVVVPNPSGNGFQTITLDRGKFDSLSGNSLTITEGTPSATYKTLTLTIPSGATVVRDGAAAKLSDLKSGDQVAVLRSPARTRVVAIAPGFRPQFPFGPRPLTGATGATGAPGHDGFDGQGGPPPPFPGAQPQ